MGYYPIVQFWQILQGISHKFQMVTFLYIFLRKNYDKFD